MDLGFVQQTFGEFGYTSIPDGSIIIMGQWVKQNIVKIQVLNQTLWVHRLLKPQLTNILIDLGCAKLIEEFDLSHGGGGFVPRHQLWNVLKPLSMHSWGIAIDLNPIKYPYASNDAPPRDLIDIFTANGFSWGGYWKTKDPMHFEFRSFVK
jgi:hypothetical protein